MSAQSALCLLPAWINFALCFNSWEKPTILCNKRVFSCSLVTSLPCMRSLSTGSIIFTHSSYFCSFYCNDGWIQLDSLNPIIPGQVAVLQEERNSLLAENDVLTDRANQLDTFDDPKTPSGRKHSQLQQQLELLQEENFRCIPFCFNASL